MAKAMFNLSDEELKEKTEMDKFIVELSASEKQFVCGFLSGSRCAMNN